MVIHKKNLPLAKHRVYGFSPCFVSRRFGIMAAAEQILAKGQEIVKIAQGLTEYVQVLRKKGQRRTWWSRTRCNSA